MKYNYLKFSKFTYNKIYICEILKNIFITGNVIKRLVT